MTTTAPPARPADAKRGLRRVLGGVLLALAVSAGAGALTPLGQAYLPGRAPRRGAYYLVVLGMFGAYGFVEMAAGTLLLLVLVVQRIRAPRLRGATVASAILGAAAFVAAYALVPAVLVAL
jgi:hypothetical protein